jgi:hypothetical protein
MSLNYNPITYIRFFIFLAPIIIPSMAVLGSFYEGNFKGLFYILGLMITMVFGGLISKTAGNLVPHIGKIGGKGKTGTSEGPFMPLGSIACNILGAGSSESWGTMFSLPGPHALMLAYTTAYLILPMFVYDNVNTPNLFVLGAMLMISVLSGLFRTSSPMNCVSWTDVTAGWGTGLILGSLWFFIINQLANNANMKDITYFSDKKSDKQECKLDKKAFRCKTRVKIR